MVLEFVDGDNLCDVLKESHAGWLGESKVVGIALAVMHGLKRVHETGLVHKDIKPENMMRVHNADGTPQYKIIDFGLVIETVANEDETKETAGASQSCSQGIRKG